MTPEQSPLYQLFSVYIEAPSKHFSQLLDLSQPISVEAGTLLIQANSQHHHIYAVKTGLLRAVFTTFEGKEFSKEFYWENDIIFGIRSMLDNQPLPYSVIAEENCQLFQLPLKKYIDLVNQHYCWKDYHLKQLERHLLYKEIKEELLLLHSNEEKVQQVYEAFPDLVKRVPATLIASYLGLTPVSLSRIKKRLNL